jgi:hypothetical protein
MVEYRAINTWQVLVLDGGGMPAQRLEQLQLKTCDSIDME